MIFASMDLNFPPIEKDIITEMFEVEELTPGFKYTFKVAAVNTVGRGPFTDLLVVSTLERGMSKPKININWFKQSCELAINIIIFNFLRLHLIPRLQISLQGHS